MDPFLILARLAYAFGKAVTLDPSVNSVERPLGLQGLGFKVPLGLQGLGFKVPLGLQG